MSLNRFAYHPTQMAALGKCLAAVVCQGPKLDSAPGRLLSSAALAVLLTGCATPKDALSFSSSPLMQGSPQDSRFGTLSIAVIEESRPAMISFQKAKGKKGTVKEAIWNSAELGLSGPGAGVIVAGKILSEGCFGDPISETAIAGAVGGAATGAALINQIVKTPDIHLHAHGMSEKNAEQVINQFRRPLQEVMRRQEREVYGVIQSQKVAEAFE